MLITGVVNGVPFVSLIRKIHMYLSSLDSLHSDIRSHWPSYQHTNVAGTNASCFEQICIVRMMFLAVFYVPRNRKHSFCI